MINARNSTGAPMRQKMDEAITVHANVFLEMTVKLVVTINLKSAFN
jgi:hypothetical protein